MMNERQLKSKDCGIKHVERDAREAVPWAPVICEEGRGKLEFFSRQIDYRCNLTSSFVTTC